MSLRYSQSGSDSRPADDQPAVDDETNDQATDNQAADNQALGGPPAAEDRRSFTTGIGSMVPPAADDETVSPARPTFTAKPDGPATPVPAPTRAPDDATGTGSEGPGDRRFALEPDDGTEPERTVPGTPALAPDDGALAKPGAVPGDGPVAGAGPVPGPALASPDGGRPLSRPLPATAGLDEPLLGDAEGLRTRWQRVQAGFVDDPREAVGDAADLIEQTAQAMVGALRQRQRQLRVMWERGPAGDAGRVNGQSAANGQDTGYQDTEHLRQMMQHYRALFNQLCRP